MVTPLLLNLFKTKYCSSRNILIFKAASKSRFRNYCNIIQSAEPEIQIPNLTIPEFVFSNFDQFPDKTAVECAVTGRKYTYEEVRTKSTNLNKAFRKKLRLNKGDVVSLLLPNIPEYPICILGALQAGLVISTINPLYTTGEIQRHIYDSDAKAIITIVPLLQLALTAAKLANRKIPIIVIKIQTSETILQNSINLHEFTDTNYDIEDLPPQDTNDISIMPYSSGTTGLPKGVQHTHNTIISNMLQLNIPGIKLAETTTSTHQDVIPAVLPFFHMYGLTVVLLNNLFALNKIVCLPQFTPELFVNTLTKHKPHILYIVPPMAIFMGNHPTIKTEHLQTVRVICSGAAPLGAMDEEKIIKKAGAGLNMVQGYGLTEAIAVFLNYPLLKQKFDSPGSVGGLLPNSTAKIVPADNINGKPLGGNQSGELLIKGPQIMKGYHNKPNENKDTFVDGWLKTGDMVYYDDNKLFYVTDRLKELIKVKGYQVAPAELEEIIRNHPDVSDAAVIGVPHERYGEAPRAYITLKPNTKGNTDGIQQYVASKVANYKQLTGGIVVVNEIPKTDSGKILRKELKLQYKNENK